MSPQRCADGPVVPEPVSAALIRAARAHRALAGQLLGELGLHPGQELVTFLLAEGPRAPSALAAALGVEPPTVTKMLQRMERNGLVERSADPSDGRVRLVALTDAGRAASDGAEQMWVTLEAATVAGLDEGDRDELVRLLVLVAERLDASIGTGCADPRACSAGE